MRLKNLLVTGVPGVGKTTVLRRVAKALPRPIQGFFTEEIRVMGQRVGFRLETVAGLSATLAHVHLPSDQRVGRYHVDVAALDRIVAVTLIPDARTGLYLVDEIGKMECLSAQFIAAVDRLLEGQRPLVATIGLKGEGYIADVKRRPDVEIWEVTQGNRDELPTAILDWLGARGVPMP